MDNQTKTYLYYPRNIKFNLTKTEHKLPAFPDSDFVSVYHQFPCLNVKYGAQSKT